MSPDSHYACLQHILLKKDYMLIIDSHDVYEINKKYKKNYLNGGIYEKKNKISHACNAGMFYDAVLVF